MMIMIYKSIGEEKIEIDICGALSLVFSHLNILLNICLTRCPTKLPNESTQYGILNPVF